MAKESGIATPTREDLARLDRKRRHKGSNEEWEHPHDPEARIAKMKDGRTPLAHKVEQAVDLGSGAVVAVTIQPADRGDRATVRETRAEAGEAIAALAGATNHEEMGERVNPEGPAEVVLDKGYHSSDTLVDLKQEEVRTYCSEPDRGRRRWEGRREEQAAVYANRRRIRGERGKKLLRQRGEKIERSFAHCYETGGLRRVHLRGHRNILKRLLVHRGGVQLGSGDAKSTRQRDATGATRLPRRVAFGSFAAMEEGPGAAIGPGKRLRRTGGSHAPAKTLGKRLLGHHRNCHFYHGLLDRFSRCRDCRLG